MASTGTALFPGSATFPNTNVYPGQGDFPLPLILYSTADVSEISPAWLDATAQVRAFSVSRGRDTELSDIDAGQATVTLDNRTRTFDPNNNAAIRPLNRWWLRSQFSGETQDVFVGYAEKYDNLWPASGGVNDAVAVVSCSDEFKVLALGALPVMSPPRDTYEDRIMFDEPHDYWKMNYDVTAAKWQPPVTGQDLYCSTGSISSTDSPIIGDIDPATGALRLAAASIIKATDIMDGGAGDVSGLTEMTFETWFRTNTVAPGADQFVIAGAVPSGLVPNLQLLTTGVLRFQATNTVPTTFTVSSSALTANTWYHVVATIESGFVRLYLNGSQVASTAWVGSFVAGSPSGEIVFGGVGNTAVLDFDETAFWRHGLTATTVSQHYEAGTVRGYSQQLPGTRAAAVLDTVGSHAPRSLRAGTRTVQSVFMHGQSPLTEVRSARDAENVDAMFFVGRDGTLTLLDAAHRAASPWNTVQATFDDDGTDFLYLELTLDYSEAFLTNEWNVTRTGGTLQTATDSTSIGKYGKRPQSTTDLPVISDADASAIATAMLAKYKDPYQRVISIAPNLAHAETARVVLGRELGDRIRVFRTPPGGGARIDQTLFIQRIEISADAESPVWTVRWGVSPL